MTDPAIIAWIESAPGPFEAASMMDVWQRRDAGLQLCEVVEFFEELRSQKMGGFMVLWRHLHVF